MNKNTGKLLERIMIFSAITSFILSFLIIFETCVISENERNYIFNWFTYTFTVFSGLVFMLALQIFVSEKSKIGVHIRFIIIYIIITLVSSYFLGGADVPYLLIPVVIFHYFLESTVNDLFIYHDWFSETYSDKQGKELIEYLFHNNYSALEFARKMNSTRSMLFVLSFIQFVILLVPLLLKYKIPLLAYLFAFLFYFSVFIIFVMIGMFNKESFYAFLGFNNRNKSNRKLYKFVFLIFVTGLFLGTLLSSNHALVNIPKISERTFELKKSYETVNEPAMEVMPKIDFGQFDIPVKKKHIPNKLAGILKVVFKVIKIAGLLFAAAYLLFLLIRPFFSESWKNFVKEKRLWHFLQKVFDDLKELILSLFGIEPPENNYSKVGARTFNDSIRDFMKHSKKSRAKKIEMDRLTKYFINLINWGTKRNIIYRKNLAPAEYTQLLAEYFRTNNSSDYVKYADMAGYLYEKALYDKELLSKEEENSFRNSIDEILKFGNKV